MATKKNAKKEEAAKAQVATQKEDKKAKGGKKELTEAEKKAKREKMKERLKNRPEGQRPNSKQCDIIELENGSKVMTFAQNVRKYGVVLTSVAVDAEGNVISTSITTLGGASVKVKKGHGNLVPKVPGMGKKGKGAPAEEDSYDDDGDEEDEE